MDSKSVSLFCDEEMYISPHVWDMEGGSSEMEVGSFYSSREERDMTLQVCMEKENCYMPPDGYVDYLSSSGLVAARFRAVSWMIKVQSQLSILIGTVFDAVNYFDRYVSANRCKEWNNRMIELLSIACLSIAAKFNEVYIPSLLQLQVEDLDHSFETREIQEMELTVMKALGWRLSCITAYSYVDLLTWDLHSVHVDLTARITELLVTTLFDPKFIKFRPCTAAVAALRCSLEELLPSKADAHLADLACLLPLPCKDEINRCYKIMEDHLVDHCCPSSPVTVFALERFHSSDCCIDFTYPAISIPKKRKISHLYR